jgi:GMP synthase-like glutamine amidotransferase
MLVFLQKSGSKAAVRGLQDLYLGLAGAVMTTLPAAAVFFATSEACKHAMEKNFGCER